VIDIHVGACISNALSQDGVQYRASVQVFLPGVGQQMPKFGGNH